MHTILPHQVLIAFAVTLLAGLATVIGGALGYFILAPFMSFSVYLGMALGMVLTNLRRHSTPCIGVRYGMIADFNVHQPCLP